MFKFGNLKCDKCGANLESFDDLSMTRTGTFVCDYCNHRFILMKCRGCKGIFKNKSENFVWKGKSTGKVYRERPEDPREPLIKCHDCLGPKISQDIHKYKIEPVPKEAIYAPEKDYSKELLNGNYKILKNKERSKTQMRGKRYLQPLVTDYEEGTPL